MVEKEDNKINKISTVTLQTFLENGCYLGAFKRKSNPKNKKFIYTRKGNIDVIDLRITLKTAQEAYKAIYDLTKNGEKIIFVCKNKNASKEVKNDALRSGSFYVTNRWVGGTLTNFETIKISIKKLKKMLQDEENGEFDRLNKKDKNRILKEKEKLLSHFEGIQGMRKIPQAIFIADLNENSIALKEAKKLGMKIFAIVNTDCDPSEINYAIPSNNNEKAIKLISNMLSDAILNAKFDTGNIVFEKEDKEKEQKYLSLSVKGTENFLLEKKRKSMEIREEKRKSFKKRRNFFRKEIIVSKEVEKKENNIIDSTKEDNKKKEKEQV